MQSHSENSPATVAGAQIALVRRHAHDVRNGLNGLAMEASLLEAVHGDEQTQACLGRMRRQAGLIDLALRFLITRFVEPDKTVVPVSDVFVLWRSRSKKLSHFDSVDWNCEVEGGALMLVDVNMVADVLCECLGYVKGSRITASVRRDDKEILFEIRQDAESSEASYSSGNEWPLFDYVVSQNGGRHDSSVAVSRKCWFPTCQSSEEMDKKFS